MEVAQQQGSLVAEVAGESLIPLPDRSLHWPTQDTLFVADLHLGKGSAFRAGAIPVPTGATQSTLERLSAAIETTQARRLCILGDLWHAQAGRTPSSMSTFEAWRNRHSRLEVVFVEGNHDRKCEPLASELGIFTVPTGHSVGPFRLVHEPEDREDGYALAGHLHPGVKLIGKGDRSMVLPAFWFGTACAVLPAFGSFTGLAKVRPKATDQVFVIAEDRILKV